MQTSTGGLLLRIYGEFVLYPEVGEISAQVYEETVHWLEFIAGFDALEEWRNESGRPIHQFKPLKH